MRGSKYEFMTRKALLASVALGDSDAMEEVKEMRTNTAITLSIIAALAAVVGGLSVGMQGCADRDRAANDRLMMETKARAELDLKRASDAAALRLKYVSACRVSPEQAEQLFPEVK